LRTYNGRQHPRLYLAILGHVFDVTKGARYYGEALHRCDMECQKDVLEFVLEDQKGYKLDFHEKISQVVGIIFRRK
jgi:predicted heme/steroid binding protein